MFSIKLNEKDIAKIKNKLNKTIAASQRKGSPVYNYRLDILNDYKETIVSAMGSVDGESGGSPTSKSFIGKDLNVTWAPLSSLTLSTKEIKGWSLSIWEASGETKEAVKVYETFAGIDGSKDQWAFEKALMTEYGGAVHEGGPSDYNKRALFTIANSIFNENKEAIKKAIAQKVVETARQQGWGR